MAFSSDLSGQEFWLIVDKGYIPLGLVLGNSVYSMGAIGGFISGLRGVVKGEIKEMTELMYNAREMAIQRMQDEAARLGADGVVGVDLKIEYMNGGQWMEVTAIGTAIKYTGQQSPSRGTVVVNT